MAFGKYRKILAAIEVQKIIQCKHYGSKFYSNESDTKPVCMQCNQQRGEYIILKMVGFYRQSTAKQWIKRSTFASEHSKRILKPRRDEVDKVHFLSRQLIAYMMLLETIHAVVVAEYSFSNCLVQQKNEI